MTCIIGFKIDGHVYMGADSAGVGGQNLTHRKDSKLFKNGDFLMGCTSSFRMIQLLKYSFIPPERHADEDIEKYMCTKFVDGIRECFKNGGFAKKKDEEESGGEFLIGYQGRLFRIESDYQVEESLDNFNACGCGEDFALGAMSILEKMDIKPEDKIRKALESAEYFSTSVSSPFLFDWI